jgi:hypothetical protein
MLLEAYSVFHPPEPPCMEVLLMLGAFEQLIDNSNVVDVRPLQRAIVGGFSGSDTGILEAGKPT